MVISITPTLSLAALVVEPTVTFCRIYYYLQNRENTGVDLPLTRFFTKRPNGLGDRFLGFALTDSNPALTLELNLESLAGLGIEGIRGRE